MAKREQKQNNEYWEKRIKQEQAYMERATDVGALNEHFERAIDDIQQKIDHEYARLEKLGFNRNKVETADIKAYEREAKQLVKEADNIRASLGRNAKKSDFTQAVNDRMTIYNATMRINRLEYLKSETALSLTKAGVNTVGDMQKELTKKYMNERKRQSGILGETIRPASADKVFKQVMAQTDGATFSDRIWRNTDELKAQLDVLLTNNQIQGQNPRVIARRLRGLVDGQFTDKAKYVTERIARTESTRMIGAAQLDSFREAGLKYTKWIAEASACDFCEDIAHGGKNGEGVYKLDKVPAYPHHPNCKCSLAGYYNPDDEKQATSKKEQASDDLVDDPVLNSLQKMEGIKANDIRNINKIINNAPENVQRLYKQFAGGEIKQSVGRNFYNADDDILNLSKSAYTQQETVGVSPKLSYGTLFHEIGHKIDYKASFGAVEQSMQKGLAASAKREYKKLAKEKEFDNFVNTLSLTQEMRENNGWGGFSDVMNGASGGKINAGVGHYNKKGMPDKAYYSKRLGTEIFANLFETTALNSDGRKLFEKYFPKTTAKFDDILRGTYEEG